jgi:hypothetical protein
MPVASETSKHARDGVRGDVLDGNGLEIRWIRTFPGFVRTVKPEDAVRVSGELDGEGPRLGAVIRNTGQDDQVVPRGHVGHPRGEGVVDCGLREFRFPSTLTGGDDKVIDQNRWPGGRR